MNNSITISWAIQKRVLLLQT